MRQKAVFESRICSSRTCNQEFQPKRAGQRFCQKSCRDADRNDARRTIKYMNNAIDPTIAEIINMFRLHIRGMPRGPERVAALRSMNTFVIEAALEGL